MNCHEASMLIAAVADGEATRRMRTALGAHMRTCAACATAQRDLSDLRERVRAEVPYYTAPPELRARVQEAVRREVPARGFQGWTWFGAGALGGALATVLAWLVVTLVVAERAQDDLVQQAVRTHVRATTSNQVIAVASSDQHTVKPWLSARLDYSPPVPRLDATGFVLAGGRLDELQGHAVATLVYHYRDHVVDVFVQPASGRAPDSVPHTVRGFNVVQSTGSAMDWIVVSDVSLDVLQGFARALAAPDAAR